MSRTFAIGDIHGGLKALKQLLTRADVTSSDTLIFLGDYVDGWSDSPQVLSFLIDLGQKMNCIFIKGNHDDLLLQWLDSSRDNREWYKHGGESTVMAYTKISLQEKQQHIIFLKSLKNYYIDRQNRLFVHAGFTNLHGIEMEYFPRLCFWDRTLWETALALDKSIEKTSPRYPRRLKRYIEIFIGHTPVTQVGETKPTQMANVWNVDTGAAFKGKLSMIEVNSKQIYQSEPVYELYPNENGRN
jgi:serine/threonine protein phosphatase 1